MKDSNLDLTVTNNNLVDNNSYVRIDNYGAYIMRFTLIYYVSPNVGVVLESGDFGAGEGKRLEYPPSAIKIDLKVDVEVFIGIYKTFFNKTFNTTEKRCYEAYGATVNPYLVQKQCPQYDNSYFSVENDGFLVVRFYVDYTTPDGKTTSLYSGVLFISQRATLYYPPNIVNVKIRIQVMVFIDVFKTYFEKSYTTPDRRCFSVTGPALGPSITETTCFD